MLLMLYFDEVATVSNQPELNQLLDSLDELFRGWVVSLARARSKLYAMIPYVSNLKEGQTYKWDVDRQWFECISGGAVYAQGPLQVLGSYAFEAEEFLWGWHNKSLPAEATETARELVEALPEIAPLTEYASIKGVEPMFFENLGQYVAWKSDWLGCYPAPMGKASVLLLVKLSTDPDLGFAPEDNPWCNLCGRLPAEAPMVQGAAHAAVCARCAEFVLEIIEDRDMQEAAQPEQRAQTAPGSTVEEDPDIMDNFDFCLCCAKKSRRSVAADYATLCEECARYVIEETEAASR